MRLFRYRICGDENDDVKFSPQTTLINVNPLTSSTNIICDIKFLDDLDILVVGRDEGSHSAIYTISPSESSEEGYVVRIAYSDDLLFSQSHSDADMKDILSFKRTETELPFNPGKVACSGTRRVICIVDTDGQRFKTADLMEDHVPSESTLMSS